MTSNLAALAPPAPASEASEAGRPPGLGLRFACAYLAIYHLAFTNDFPGSEWLSDRISDAEFAVVRWLGGLAGIGVPNKSNGSGDTTFNYLELAILAVLAAVVALAWWRLREPRRDERIYRAVRVFLRYMAAYFMLTYGVIKMLALQMPPPGPGRLMERIGDASPMGLLWTFMGASKPYQMFAGAAEVVAGVLLLFRRTTTLGALVTCGVMTNVVMMNFCYDVPVKLFSTHLLATGAFLLVPDLRRLADVLVLGRPVAAKPPEPRPTRASRVAKLLVVLFFVWAIGKDAVDGYFKYGAGAPVSPLRGIWTVESLVRDGRPVPRFGAGDGWRRVMFDFLMTVQLLDESTVRYRFEHDAAAGTLSTMAGVRPVGALLLRRPDPQHMILAGVLAGRLIEAQLVRDDGKMLLVERGFRWINEFPFNR